MTWSPNSFHSMDFGFEGRDLDFKLNHNVVDSKYKNAFSGRYGALYVQDNYKWNALNIFQAGLRAEYYSDGDYTRQSTKKRFRYTLQVQADGRVVTAETTSPERFHGGRAGVPAIRSC